MDVNACSPHVLHGHCVSSFFSPLSVCRHHSLSLSGSTVTSDSHLWTNWLLSTAGAHPWTTCLIFLLSRAAGKTNSTSLLSSITLDLNPGATLLERAMAPRRRKVRKSSKSVGLTLFFLRFDCRSSPSSSDPRKAWYVTTVHRSWQKRRFMWLNLSTKCEIEASIWITTALELLTQLP